MAGNISKFVLSDDFSAYLVGAGQALKAFGPLSQVNIIVGANNSGKSRLLRLLSEHCNEYIDQTHEVSSSIEALTNSVTQLEGVVGQFEFRSNMLELRAVRPLLPVPKTFLFQQDSYKLHREYFKSLSASNLSKPSIVNRSGGGIPVGLWENVQKWVQSAESALVQLPDLTNLERPVFVYIPVLRGLRRLQDSNGKSSDFYFNRTQTDYFRPNVGRDNTNSKIPRIFTGLTLFDEIHLLRNGGSTDRARLKRYEQFLSDSLFEGAIVELIPHAELKEVVVKIGSEREQPIQHLGDGIQSVILLTFLAVTREEPMFFFIEEPETHLHPGFQRKLLELFASRKQQQHRFFLTTQSNHLLDLTIDVPSVSVFSVRKLIDTSTTNAELSPTFIVELVDTGGSSSLEMLGVRNSSVFLVNATIWVEGITDRLYLRAMLDSYQDYRHEQGESGIRFSEDIHYAFVEYAGSNIMHWSFLESEEPQIIVERLCARAMVIIDEDGSTKMERKEKLQEKMGNRLIILDCREVENLLPYEVIAAVVAEYEKSDSGTLPKFDYEYYRRVYLGEFIEAKILEEKMSRRGGYKTDSGTIKDKVGFCHKALSHIRYATLPESTQSVVRRIFDFIQKENSRY